MKKNVALLSLIMLIGLLISCSKSLPADVESDIKEPLQISNYPNLEETPSLLGSIVNITKTSEPEVVPLPTQPLEYINLSDNIMDFTFILDGDVLKLPMPLEVFLSYGWEPQSAIIGTFLPGDYSTYHFVRNDKYVSVDLTNMSDEIRYVSKSTVYSINTSWTNAELELPHGISKGISNMDDVITAFGEPSRSSEWDTGYAIFYGDDYSSSVDIYFDDNDIKISRIYLRNRIQIPSDLISDKATVYSDITDRERQYIKPTELGDDLSSFNINIEGDLYRLPAPVSEFINNGWVFGKSTTDIIPGNRRIMTGFTLIKDDYELSIELKNYDSRPLIKEKCFVVAVETSNISVVYNGSIFLPGMITIGTPLSELLTQHNIPMEKGESWWYGDYVYSLTQASGDNRIVFDINSEEDGKEVVIALKIVNTDIYS